jgi:hypothetical protein
MGRVLGVCQRVQFFNLFIQPGKAFIHPNPANIKRWPGVEDVRSTFQFDVTVFRYLFCHVLFNLPAAFMKRYD